MRRVMVRYNVKSDRAAGNDSNIIKVFEQLRNEKPSGLRAVKAFTAQIIDRCEEPPIAVDLKEVGSYRFFGD